MTKVLRTFKKARPPGIKAKYPWQKIFSGKHIYLEKGIDFTCTVASITDLVYKTARRWCATCEATKSIDIKNCPTCEDLIGIEVCVNKHQDGIVVTAYPE